ncbi:Acetyltransferase, GNAT family [Aphelenchoides fujianensis]|nr:Acetyltransferase, GNAT family [Aphelenchoides fujianensis]
MTISASFKRHFLDVRLRETLDESFYVERQHSTVRFQVAEVEDEAAILDFICDVTRRTEPLDVASGLSAEDLRRWHAAEIKTWLTGRSMLVVSDCFEIVGVAAGCLVQLDPKKPKKPLELLPDYAEVIDQTECAVESGKGVLAFIEEIESFTSNFLPADCSQLFRIDLVSVHPEYQGGGLGVKLWKEMMRLARGRHVEHVASTCSAIASTRIAQKFGMKSVFQLPYAGFTRNGVPVLGERMHDGATEANLMLGELAAVPELLADDSPRLPKAYELPAVERKVRSEVEVKRLGRTIRYVIARPEDAEVIKDFLKNEYFRQTTITRTLQCTREDGEELITRFKPEVLERDLVVLAVDGQRLCGLAINKVMPLDRSGDQWKRTEIPEDFAERMEQQPASHKGVKAIKAVCRWMDEVTPAFVPADFDEVFVFDILSTRPDYRGCKIGYHLWLETLN